MPLDLSLVVVDGVFLVVMERQSPTRKGKLLVCNQNSMVTLGTIKKKCPRCRKNDEVIPILYGEPTQEAMEDINRGLRAMGGCIVDFDSPNWYCKRDELEF